IGLKAVGALGVRQSYFSEKVQVLIDGMTITDPSNGSSFSSNNNISLANAERVEIIYGPMASLYGFNSALAVINIVTVNPDKGKREFRTAVSTGGDSDTAFYTAFNKKGIKGLFSLSYREDRSPHRSYTDVLGRTSSYSSYFKHFTYYFKLENKSGLYFNSYGINRDNSFPVSISFLADPKRSYVDRIAYINRIGIKKKFDSLFFNASVHYNWFYIKRGYDICPKDINLCQSVSSEGLHAVEKRYVKNPGVDLFASFNTEYGKLSFGFEMEQANMYKTKLSANFIPSSLACPDPKSIKTRPYSELPPSEKILNKKSRIVKSPYFQYFLNFDRSSILLNARYDEASDVGGAGSYSVSYLYKLSNTTRLKLNAGRATRIPSFEELYIKNNNILTGNPNLKIEKLYSLMPSLEYEDEEKSGSLAFYTNWFKDLIYKKPVNPISRKWDNYRGTVRITGILLHGEKIVFDRFKIYLGVNRRFSTHGLNSSEFFSFPKWKLVTSGTFKGERSRVTLTAKAVSRISKNTPGYAIFSLFYDYSINRKVTVEVRLDNLLNRKYRYENGVPGVERTLWVGTRVSF
ncbi:MAG: TonB-dependent receptor, partial [Desulfurobacteriaceae bacterium]